MRGSKRKRNQHKLNLYKESLFCFCFFSFMKISFMNSQKVKEKELIQENLFKIKCKLHKHNHGIATKLKLRALRNICSGNFPHFTKKKGLKG